MEIKAFQEMSISQPLQQAIADMGFQSPTEIQAASIPLIQAGYDVIGRSQTGTGKTLAFGIPAVERVDVQDDRRLVQVLILCPTRELAMQAAGELKKLARYRRGVKVVEIYGGAAMDRQIAKLKMGAHIVVGTPGRVMDHMRRRTINLEALKMLILDEADEMLNMGFREDIETVLQDVPQDRQTILFSATMPQAILDITAQYQKEPQLVQVSRREVSLDTITQTYYDVPAGRKLDALNLILCDKHPHLAMVFCNTKKMVDEVVAYLEQHGFDIEGLHGDMKQTQRTKVLDAFKQGRASVLVATDVAARGIDVQDIDYVINYDIPQNMEYYVHRIGRTGRAGKEGNAITICTGRRQVSQLLEIGRMVKANITAEQIPTTQQILENQRQRDCASVERALLQTQDFPYLDMVQTLMEKGYSAQQIAAVVLDLHFGGKKLAVADIIQEKQVSPHGFDIARIALDVGRRDRIAPNHIVAALADRTGMSGKEIGKIEISDDQTVVSIPASELEDTLRIMSGSRINGKRITVRVFAPSDRSSRSMRSYEGEKGTRKKDYRRLDKKQRSSRYNRKG